MTSVPMELWELVARERIRDSLAQYNWSGDALRLEELAEAFSADGVLEVRGGERFEGRAAIVAFLGGVAGSADAAAGAGRQRIVRHNLTNVRFLELTSQEARVASYFTVVTELGLDHYGRYRDTFVPDGDAWRIQHRLVSTDWRADGSLMAPSNR